MIGPKKKRSIRKKHIRHAAWRTKVIKKLHATTQLTSCSNCGKTKLNHRVCPHCGWYAGKQVITINTWSSDKVLDA